MKSVFSVKSLSREESGDPLLFTMAFTTARVCPRFLAMKSVNGSPRSSSVFVILMKAPDTMIQTVRVTEFRSPTDSDTKRLIQKLGKKQIKIYS